MDAPLISDGQAAALVAAIVAGFGTAAAAIKWGVGRIVKAIDDQTADAKLVRETLAEMKAEVREGRADIREVREIAVQLFAQLQPEESKRRTKRTVTPAAGVPRRVDSEH